MEIKISIIVPVYNVENYIHKCIRSILEQTYHNFELILIDDGSKDSSGRICDQYALEDKRIKVFHQKNKGVSIARNLGISKSSGNWLTFLDSDDWVENYYLENITKLIQHNNIDIVCCNYFKDFETSYLPNDGTNYEIQIRNNNKEIYNLLLMTVYSDYYKYINEYKFDMTPIWNKIYKSSIIKTNNIQFKETLTRSEDVLFNIEYIKKTNSIAFTSECFVHYVKRSNSITNTIHDNIAEILVNSATEINKALPINDNLIKKCLVCRYLKYLLEFTSTIMKNTNVPFKRKINDIKLFCKLINEIKFNPLKNEMLSLKFKILVSFSNLKLYYLIYIYYLFKI